MTMEAQALIESVAYFTAKLNRDFNEFPLPHSQDVERGPWEQGSTLQ